MDGVAPAVQRRVTANAHASPASPVADGSIAVPVSIDSAALHAVVYSDIFDYPLSAAEIHRYLAGVKASRETVAATLQDGQLVPRHLAHHDGYYMLPGRGGTVETRRQREQAAERLWPRALHYGRIIASLPFVRMVAVTGELAVDNVGPESDIDYFIVTAPDRLWLCRLFAIAVVRYARFRGDVVCPNYLISERALELHDRNLYTAHELAQLTPIWGMPVYRRLRALNTWIDDYLPNAAGSPRNIAVTPRGRPLRALAERLLRAGPVARIERWEMERKVRKLTRDSGHSEAAYSADWCKGHVNGHGDRILAAYQEHRRTLETVPS
jgi:hypothetical protein